LQEIVPFNYEFDISQKSGYPKRVMDISRARKTIGYNPETTLREGLEKTWKWLKRH